MSTIVDETAANFASRPFRRVVIVFVALVAPLSLMVITCVEVQSSIVREEMRTDLGSHVFTVSNDQNRPLDAGRCDQLNTVSGVMTAGGVLASSAFSVPTDPGYLGDYVRVTPGYLRVLWPSVEKSELVKVGVGSSLAANFGLVSGAHLAIVANSQPLFFRVDYVAVEDRRFPTFSRAIVVVEAPTGSVLSCYVEVQAGASDDVATVLAGWFADSGQVTVTSIWSADQSQPTLQDELASRISQWVPFILAATVILVWCFSWMMRRQEISVYRMLGLSTAQLVLMSLIEWSLALLAPAAAALLVAVIFAARTHVAGLALGITGIDFSRYISLLLLAPLLALLALLSVKPLDAVKGR